MMLYFENITYAMLHNVLILGLMWIGYQIIAIILKLKAKTLFKLGTTVQLAATLLFLLEVTQLYNYPIQYMNKITISVANPHYYLAIIGIAYCLILLYLIGKFIFYILALNDLKKSIVIDHSLMEVLANTNLQVPPNLIIGYSKKVSSPVVFGFLEPVILLPFALCNQLTINEIKLILIHELAHIVRNDYLFNYFHTIAKIILWFNPFNHILSKSLSLQREIACDEMVLQDNQATPLLYTKVLYQLSLLNKNNHNELRLAAVQHQGELITRIQKINNIVKGNKFSFQPIIAIVALTVMLCINIHPVKQFNSHTNAHFSDIKYTTKHNPTLMVQNVSLKHRNRTVNKRKNETSEIKQYVYTKKPEVKEQINEDNQAYNELISQTKNWIKARQNPIQFANYDQQRDSVEDIIAEKWLITSIVRSYQLKKAILTEKLQMAKDSNEAYDYLYNSKEWAEIKEYEKWAKAYLERHQ